MMLRIEYITMHEAGYPRDLSPRTRCEEIQFVLIAIMVISKRKSEYWEGCS